jgi:hypothetical protein
LDELQPPFRSGLGTKFTTLESDIGALREHRNTATPQHFHNICLLYLGTIFDQKHRSTDTQISQANLARFENYK